MLGHKTNTLVILTATVKFLSSLHNHQPCLKGLCLHSLTNTKSEAVGRWKFFHGSEVPKPSAFLQEVLGENPFPCPFLVSNFIPWLVAPSSILKSSSIASSISLLLSSPFLTQTLLPPTQNPGSHHNCKGPWPCKVTFTGPGD